VLTKIDELRRVNSGPSTGERPEGIAIVRVSGPLCWRCARRPGSLSKGHERHANAPSGAMTVGPDLEALDFV